MRHQPVEQAGEPDRLLRQVRPHQILARGRGIAFGEHQINHRQHSAQPRRQRVALRHLVGDAGEADFLLGAHQALRHRVFGREKRPRDLRGGEPADGAQGQRDLHLDGECRMAADEDQPQHVVVEGCIHHLVRGLRVELDLVRQLLLLAAKIDLPPHPVDRLVARDIDQPCARVGRRWRIRPAFQRHRERVLQGFFGQVEIADQADQGRKRPARLVAERCFDFVRRHALFDGSPS